MRAHVGRGCAGAQPPGKVAGAPADLSESPRKGVYPGCALVEEITREFKKSYEVIDIDGARVIFPGGWGLIRASNTNPYLTLRFEAKTAEQIEEMKQIVYAALSHYPFITLPG